MNLNWFGKRNDTAANPPVGIPFTIEGVIKDNEAEFTKFEVGINKTDVISDLTSKKIKDIASADSKTKLINNIDTAVKSSNGDSNNDTAVKSSNSDSNNAAENFSHDAIYAKNKASEDINFFDNIYAKKIKTDAKKMKIDGGGLFRSPSDNLKLVMNNPFANAISSSTRNIITNTVSKTLKSATPHNNATKRFHRLFKTTSIKRRRPNKKGRKYTRYHK